MFSESISGLFRSLLILDHTWGFSKWIACDFRHGQSSHLVLNWLTMIQKLVANYQTRWAHIPNYEMLSTFVELTKNYY